MTTVGFVANHLERGGGLELYELAMAEGLHALGWNVVAAYEHDGDLGDRWRAATSVLEQYDGVHLPAVLKEADVLYVHPTSVIARAGRFGAAAGIPVVAHLHLPPESLRTGWKGMVRGRRRSGHPEAELLLPDAGISRYLAVSHHTAALWRQLGLPADRIGVVHNGVDLDRFRPAGEDERAEIRRELGIAAGAIVVGYVGRIDPTKGIEQLLTAFDQVARDEAREVVLVVLGEASRHMGGADSRYTSGLVARSGPGVHWLGRRPDPERVMRAFDLLVVPSQWDEPFGLVAVEAMASGVAVIGARRGGLPEVFGDHFHGHVVDPTPAGLATAIHRLISVPARLQTLGRASRAHAEKRFSLTDAVETMQRELEGVLRYAQR